MQVNYIKHLEAVTVRMAEDTRLNTSHVSMYLALFLIWNHNRFQNPLSINRSEVMKLSKIGSKGTYHRCINDLNSWSYLKYNPSHNALKGSIIYMYNFGTSTEQVVGQVEGQLLGQVSEPSINNIKQIKQLNISNDCKVDSKIDKKTKSKNEKFSPPSLEEAILFFKGKEKSENDGERFYNHFESNGWLVGGKTKMKNWQAAARNWILNSSKFQTQKSTSVDRLHVNQDKDYSVPL